MKKVTNKYYVPVVFLDCDFEEGLFYKILPDYPFMIERAKKILEEEHPYLIMDTIINDRIKEQITDNFSRDDIYIHSSNGNIKEFLSQKKGRKGIVIGDLLGMLVERYVDNANIVVLSSNYVTDQLLADTKRIIVSNKRKAETATQICKKLINLDYDINGHTRILLQPNE